MAFSARSMMRLLTLFLLAMFGYSATGQLPADGTIPKFEFASIRQNVGRQVRWRMLFTADGVSAVDVTLQYMLEAAYNLYDPKRWSGGPTWINERRFNLEARYDPIKYKNITPEQDRLMLQQLLANRFGLVVHHDAKELPVYELRVTTQMPKLVPLKRDQNAGTLYRSSCRISHDTEDHLQMSDCTLSNFISVLTPMAASDLNRNIVDQTGLTGHYNFDLSWTPEDPNAAARIDSGAPTIFPALKKELGLELKPAKGVLDTIVVDRAEMPSPN